MKSPSVGFSVDVFTIESSDKTFKARRLDDAEVAEHVEFIRASEDALRGVQQSIASPASAQEPVDAPPTLNQP